MKILDLDKNMFKRIFYGKYYLVEYLENDPVFHCRIFPPPVPVALANR